VDDLGGRITSRWLVGRSRSGDIVGLGGREHRSDRVRVAELGRVVGQAVNGRQSEDAGCVVVGGAHVCGRVVSFEYPKPYWISTYGANGQASAYVYDHLDLYPLRL
jgi:hypothetical protein